MSGRPTMWRSILETQWRWTRGLSLLGVLLGFTIPLLSLRTALTSESTAGFVAIMQGWGVAYAIVAGAVGLMTAIAAWGYDHRLRHVYALSLPIARWKYVLFRFGAGTALLLLPVLSVFVSSEIVAHSKLVPDVLHAYPVALTLRFAFALLVAYALFFAVSSATGKTAGFILGAIAVILVAQVVLSTTSVSVNLLGRAIDVIFATPGLLAVFAGRWTLIDV
jgi:hypothetical protein